MAFCVIRTRAASRSARACARKPSAQSRSVTIGFQAIFLRSWGRPHPTGRDSSPRFTRSQSSRPSSRTTEAYGTPRSARGANRNGRTSPEFPSDPETSTNRTSAGVSALSARYTAFVSGSSFLCARARSSATSNTDFIWGRIAPTSVGTFVFRGEAAASYQVLVAEGPPLARTCARHSAASSCGSARNALVTQARETPRRRAKAARVKPPSAISAAYASAHSRARSSGAGGRWGQRLRRERRARSSRVFPGSRHRTLREQNLVIVRVR